MIVETLILSATVAYLFHLAVPLFGRKLAVQERLAAVSERDVELREKEAVKPVLAKPEPPPQDLLQWALGEATTWAQEDALKRMYELYDATKNWDAVRERFLLEVK